MKLSVGKLAISISVAVAFAVIAFLNLRLKGRSVEFLTEHTDAVDMQPSFSPDGKTLAFVRFKELVLLDLSTRSVKKVRTKGLFGIAHPAWSPDGKKLAFSAFHSRSYRNDGGGAHLIVMDLKTLEWKCLTPGSDFNTRPSWSPDGKKLAFTKLSMQGASICVYDFQRKQLQKLGLQWGRSPSWSPDGKTIAFISSRTKSPDVWLIDANGQNLRPLFEDERTDEDMPCWTVDGKFVVFSRQNALASGPKKRDLWAVKLADKTAFQLTECPQNWWAMTPSASPDGKSLVFALRRSDHSVICRIFVDWNKIKPQRLGW